MADHLSQPRVGEVMMEPSELERTKLIAFLQSVVDAAEQWHPPTRILENAADAMLDHDHPHPILGMAYVPEAAHRAKVIEEVAEWLDEEWPQGCDHDDGPTPAQYVRDRAQPSEN